MMSILFALSPLAVMPPAIAAPAPKKKKKRGRKKKSPEWEVDWYVRPSAGVTVVGNGANSEAVVTLGGEAGITHDYVNTPPPRWGGRTRVKADYMIAQSGAGTDVRLGSFFGPSWKNFGVEAGPDVFWNRWNTGGFALDPTFGVDLPIIARARVDALSAYGGVAPTWVSNVDRRVDWTTIDTPGFGHEFSYLAGASAQIDALVVGVSYVYRITVSGPQQSLSAHVDLATVIRGGNK